MVNVHDKLLVWRFNRGDCDAVREIYDKYKHGMLAVASGLLKDPAAAEDVVHDAFLAFLKLDRFKLTGSLRAYLATCVANAARNVIRFRTRHQHEPFHEDTDFDGAAGAPDGEVIYKEENEILSEAIHSLPYDQREVVMLHLSGGLKFAEIAESQSVSINTVQGRYRYGLHKIKAKLNGEVFGCQTAQTQSKS